MAHIPAVCTVCDTNFQSILEMRPEMEVQQNLTNCPYCGGSAWILDGYVAIIKGLVNFVTSPRHTYEEKKDFLNTVRSVVKSEVNETEAERTLRPINEDGWKLVRECASLGMTFLALVISVAAFALDYRESGRNQPLEDVAAQRVDQILSEKIPFERLKLKSEREPTPGPVFSAAEPEVEEIKGTAAKSDSPDEDG